MESVSSRGGDVNGVGNLKSPFAVSHFLTVVYFAFAFFFSRLFLDRFVFHVRNLIFSYVLDRCSCICKNYELDWLLFWIFQRISVWLLRTGSSPLKLNDATRVKIIKCKESLWKLLYYAGCEICVLGFVYPELWFGDIKLYFDGWPNQELKWVIKLAFSVFFHLLFFQGIIYWLITMYCTIIVCLLSSWS